MTLGELKERIDSFAKLEPGWNDPGDKIPSQRTRETAIGVAMALPGEGWFVAPTGEGEIIFERGKTIITVWDP